MVGRPSPVQIPHRILEDVYREARNSFPAECCGWLAGARNSSTVSVVRPCINAQASGAHPAARERTAERAYTMSTQDVWALYQSLDSDTPALIIYHSHSNGQAYFSPLDHEVATNPMGGGPMYPVQQLVVGIDQYRVVEAALFAWSEEDNDFVEIARYEGADI